MLIDEKSCLVPSNGHQVCTIAIVDIDKRNNYAVDAVAIFDILISKKKVLVQHYLKRTGMPGDEGQDASDLTRYTDIRTEI